MEGIWKINRTHHKSRNLHESSSQEQAEKGTSLESQAEQLEAFCKAQKWEVFNQYTDGGFSGKDDKRPGLNLYGGMPKPVTLKRSPFGSWTVLLGTSD